MKLLTYLTQYNHGWRVQEIFIKNIESRNRGYEGHIEGSYPGDNFQRARGPAQISNQAHGQVSVIEAPNKTQEEYPQLHFIQSLQSEIIPAFEEYLCRSNVLVKMSQQ